MAGARARQSEIAGDDKEESGLDSAMTKKWRAFVHIHSNDIEIYLFGFVPGPGGSCHGQDGNQGNLQHNSYICKITPEQFAQSGAQWF